MVMDFSAGHVIRFPRQRWRPLHMDHVLRVEQIRFQQVVEGINRANAVNDDGVSVIVRRQWRGVHSPNALVVFLHRHLLGAFSREFYFLRVGSEETKRHAVVGMNFGRIQRWRPLRNLSRRGLGLLRRRQTTKSQERKKKKERLKFHGAVSSGE